MNDNIKLFENPEFGQVRVIVQENNEPLFCLADICRVLDISNSRNVVSRIDEKGVRSIDTLTNGGVQSLNFISEQNLYRVIFQSRKEGAIRFQDWVFNEVLPSIRKTGSYSVKPMTTLEMLAVQVQAMVELERKQREYDNALQGLSQDVDELKRVRVEAEQQLKALPLSEEKTPEKSLRAVVNELARQYQRLTGCEYSEVWNKAYKDLYYKYGISVNGIKEAKKGESKLSKLERKGHLEEVKIILSEMIRDGGVN
jgi:prophage antirepressor-like protein